jgi:K+-sensing histidine kinase KdpD
MTKLRHQWAAHRTAGLLLVAVASPMAAGALLIPLRDRIDNANVALILVVAVVAVAAAGRREAAAVSALSAAAAFNLFHTRPYFSLRITSGDDVTTAVLLLLVALAVGELALRGRRAHLRAEREHADLRSIQGLGRLVVDGEDADYVVLATASELTHLLHLVDCRYERTWHDPRVLPVVERDGTVQWGPTRWASERWGLPSDGVAIPVRARGREWGRFHLRAPIALPYSPDQLSRAVALVEQAARAVADGSAHAA